MNAWQRLLAASSLAVGTAWELLTHPRTGGTGVVVNTGAQADVNDRGLAMAVTDRAMSVIVADTAPLANVMDTALAVIISTKPINA